MHENTSHAYSRNLSHPLTHFPETSHAYSRNLADPLTQNGEVTAK